MPTIEDMPPMTDFSGIVPQDTIPFQNSYSGPAGEYSDAYKAIVDQYRNELDAAASLGERTRQAYINSGLQPPSMMGLPGIPQRQFRPIPAPRRQLFKSGEDIFDATSGQIIHRGPERIQPIPRPSAWENKRIDIAAQRVSDLQKEMMGAGPNRRAALQAELDAALSEFNGMQPAVPAMTPEPGSALQPPPLSQPQTATITAPPAPRFYSGPANGLDAPLQTTQAAPQERKAIGGYKIGTVYRGLKYIGGDPKSESSWQRAR